MEKVRRLWYVVGNKRLKPSVWYGQMASTTSDHDFTGLLRAWRAGDEKALEDSAD